MPSPLHSAVAPLRSRRGWTRAVWLLGALAGLPAGAQTPRACPAVLDTAVFAPGSREAPRVRDSLRLTTDAGATLRSFAFPNATGESVTGLLAVPQTPGRHAALVYLSGFPVHPARAQAAVLELAEQGFVVALVWPPVARPDGAGTGSPITFTLADSVGAVRFVRDIRRTVDLLAARSDVDPARIGLAGGSYGGATGSLVAGIEPRLRAVALWSFDGGPVDYVTDPEGPGLPDDVTPDEAARWAAAMQTIEPGCFAGRARMPVLLQFGRTDPILRNRAARTAAAFQAPDVRWYDAGHRLTPEATQERIVWLRTHLQE